MNGGSDWTDIQAKLLGAFVGFGVLSLILIYLFVPETKLAAAGKKGKRNINYLSLEELNHIFKVYTRDFIRWQLFEVLPYEVEIFKYIIGMRKDKPQLEVLHRWAEDRRENAESGDDGDGGSQRRNSGDSEMEQVQRAYNQAPDDSRRGGQGRARNQQNRMSREEIRRVNDTEDTIAQLPPPTPQFQESERAGSIDWDPNTHPDPDSFSSPPRSRAGPDEAESTVARPSENRPSRESERAPFGQAEDSGQAAQGVRSRVETTEPHDDDSPQSSSPQIRRKPVPPRSSSSDYEVRDSSDGE